MNSAPQPIVRRVRKVSGDSVTQQFPLSEGNYRGFGSVPGETEEQFHDRMFEIDPTEAMLYEMEFALGKCPISSTEIDQGMTHEEVDVLESEELLIRESMGVPLFTA